MKFKNLEKKSPQPELLETVRAAQEGTANILGSMGEGFVFPVHEKVRNLEETPLALRPHSPEHTTRKELLRLSIRGLEEAWRIAIQPHIGTIRTSDIKRRKVGIDFFTEADTRSEGVIKDIFTQRFGDNVRIFGEESGIYLGDLNVRIGLRIDPVDGTESMKFGKPDWGIMVGAYEGTPEHERQICGVVYYPEHNTLAYSVDSAGVFISDVETGETRQIPHVPEQNSFDNVIIQMSEHKDPARRPVFAFVMTELAGKGARIRITSSACTDVLEALLTHGKRAMVIDGDYVRVDFIPYAFLEHLGYRIYEWGGALRQADDPAIADQQLIVVPPGEVGREILEITKRARQL